jgi:nitrate/TMAO reductase-like tetraheme cytochrome c subunit
VTTIDGNQTTVTNLCISCHSEETNYHFREVPKHPSDYFDTEWGASSTYNTIFVSTGTMSVYSTHDPANAGIGFHIDQYVDHWAEWGNEATTDPSDDIQPFLPLGDSLNSGWDADNDSADRVTCITCHNPHGSDLFVIGKTPGSPDGEAQDLANKMLRLRDTDGEMCGACHK